MSKDTERALAAVRTAETRARDAREKLHLAMRQAKRSGASLRAIAEASGLSPETVRTIGRSGE